MYTQNAVLNPQLDFVAAKPCVNCSAICHACGSPVLAGHRYCVSCQRGVEIMNNMSIIFPLPKGAVGRKCYAA